MVIDSGSIASMFSEGSPIDRKETKAIRGSTIASAFATSYEVAQSSSPDGERMTWLRPELVKAD